MKAVVHAVAHDHPSTPVDEGVDPSRSVNQRTDRSGEAFQPDWMRHRSSRRVSVRRRMWFRRRRQTHLASPVEAMKAVRRYRGQAPLRLRPLSSNVGPHATPAASHRRSSEAPRMALLAMSIPCGIGGPDFPQSVCSRSRYLGGRKTPAVSPGDPVFVCFAPPSEARLLSKSR